MTLGHLGAVRIEQNREVGVEGRRHGETGVQIEVQRQRREPFLSRSSEMGGIDHKKERLASPRKT